MRFELIKAEKAHHDVALLCRVLNVTRQGFYAWLRRKPCARQRQEHHLTSRIWRAYHDSRGRYGAPRVHEELQSDGIRTSRKRVARLMRQQGLVARPRRRFVRTTDSRHDHRTAPNLLERNFTPEGSNRVWASDITYIWTAQGWLYLAVVLDLFSRKIVGWAMERYLDHRLALKALQMAITTRNPAAGLVHHSDRGVQYACAEYQRALLEAEIAPSMSRKGDCWDNAPVESFFSSLKHELVHRQTFLTHAQARAALFEYIEGFYNRRRRHSTLGYLSPVEYESRSVS